MFVEQGVGPRNRPGAAGDTAKPPGRRGRKRMCSMEPLIFAYPR